MRRSPPQGLALVEDCCQAHLATCAGQPVGTFGAAGAFSFYPDQESRRARRRRRRHHGDAALAERMRAAAQRRPDAIATTTSRSGVNSRLDELQAAILRARLPLLRARHGTAARARRAVSTLLDGAPIAVPPERDPGHVYHLFPVRARQRAALQDHLRAAGIETLDALSDADSAAAGVRVARRRPTVRTPLRAAARGAVAAALSGLAADDRRSASPDGRSKGIIFVRA